MKIDKIGVFVVPLEVERLNPLLGCFIWVRLLRLKKFTVTLNQKPIFSFYRLIVPRFVKGGGADAE